VLIGIPYQECHTLSLQQPDDHATYLSSTSGGGSYLLASILSMFIVILLKRSCWAASAHLKGTLISHTHSFQCQNP